MLETDALTVEDVCQLLDVSRNTVYKLAKEGSLPSFKVGRKLRFFRSEVESVLASRSCKRSAPSTLANPGDGSSATLQQALDQVRGPLGEPFVFAGESAVLGHIAQRLKDFGYEPATAYMNSYTALVSLYTGQVDAALVSLYDFKTNSFNVPFAQRLCPGTSLVVFHLFRRRQGLFVRASNPRKISTWGAFLREDVRIATREQGSSLRILLDQKMLGMEADIEEAGTRSMVCGSNALALTRVAQGLSDVCLGYKEESLLAKGVQFVPQQMNAFGLVVHHTKKTHKALRALRQIAASQSFASELAAMMECDTASCGSVLYRC